VLTIATGTVGTATGGGGTVLQAVKKPATPRLTKLKDFVRFISISSLSVQKSSSIVELCTTAQVRVRRVRCGYFSGGFVELRFI
jgi:hypothetical protein